MTKKTKIRIIKCVIGFILSIIGVSVYVLILQLDGYFYIVSRGWNYPAVGITCAAIMGVSLIYFLYHLFYLLRYGKDE